MTINQLFKKKPTSELILRLLNLLNIDSFDSDVSFSQKTIILNNVVLKSKPIINELKMFYLPCKKKIYLENITPKKFITIIKQCIKLFNYKLVSQEKYINSDKIIIYRITPINVEQNKVKNSISYKKYTLSFD